MTDPRRLVPRADAVLADPRLAAAERDLGRARVKRAVDGALDAARRGELAPTDVSDEAVRRLPGGATALRKVINATGVVLHTNLGRAPLSSAAIDALVTAAGYVDVEYDLATGHRARRGAAALAALSRAVPDAEDVLVVNNGAAALLLACASLAAGREIVVSRGELVEIGDGFRLPDLIEATGARLREVGTTNRVTAADYAAAIGPATGCVLKVHPSNFRIQGFTRSISVRELAALGSPVVVDVGSGQLAPSPMLPQEPDVTSALRAGAAVVTCSGDKLLGGPQAGLAMGRADVIGGMRRHPLARAVRVDKLTLAALEATIDGPPTPTAAALSADPEQLRRRCVALAAHLPEADAVESAGAVGGGGAPGVVLPGWAVALPAAYAERLRRGDPPVIARIEHDRCLVDLRCVPPAEDSLVLQAILAVQ